MDILENTVANPIFPYPIFPCPLSDDRWPKSIAYGVTWLLAEDYMSTDMSESAVTEISSVLRD